MLEVLEMLPTVCEVCVDQALTDTTGRPKSSFRLKINHHSTSAYSVLPDYSRNDSGFETASPISIRARDLKTSMSRKAAVTVMVSVNSVYNIS